MRKESIVRIDNPESRDNGREFLIVEMSALRAEKWATKALLALVSSGADIGEDVNINSGIEELAKVGIKSLMGLKYEYLEPLLDEMFECMYYLRKPGDTSSRQQLSVENCENFIEDTATILKLRAETLSLHLGFSLTEQLSAFLPGQDKEKAEDTSSTKTTPDTSGRSYQEDWQHKKS